MAEIIQRRTKKLLINDELELGHGMQRSLPNLRQYHGFWLE